MLIIIDETTGQVVGTAATGQRIDLPGGAVAMGAIHGARVTTTTASFLFLEPVMAPPESSGPVVTEQPPTYDAATGVATIRTVLSDDTRPIAEQRADKIAAAMAEAERRIAAGTVVGGVPFRCDDRSVGRISGMMVSAQRGKVPIVFKTQAGNTVTITTALEAEALFDAASAHVAAMLAASSALQDAIGAMNATAIATLDVTAAIHW